MNTEKRKRTIAGGYLRRIKEKEKRGHSTIKRKYNKGRGRGSKGDLESLSGYNHNRGGQEGRVSRGMENNIELLGLGLLKGNTYYGGSLFPSNKRENVKRDLI